MGMMTWTPDIGLLPNVPRLAIAGCNLVGFISGQSAMETGRQMGEVCLQALEDTLTRSSNPLNTLLH
jgi:hypothetical protein